MSKTSIDTFLKALQPVVDADTRYQYVQDIITENQNVLVQLNKRRGQLGRNPLVWNRYLVLASHHHAIYRAGATTNGGAPQTSNLSVTNSPFGTTRVQWLEYTGFKEVQLNVTTCKSSTHTTEQSFINTYLLDNEWIFPSTTEFGCAYVQTPTNRRYVYFVGRDSETSPLHISPPPTVTFKKSQSDNNFKESLHVLSLIKYRFPGTGNIILN